MHPELRRFLAHLAGTVGITLMPVILVAFVSMPMALERHPGEPRPAAGALDRHMS